jgi:tryptophan-rich sensory protein
MDWGIFLIFLAACSAAAATGMIFQPGAWYEGLQKPDWTPPKWAFPVVWTTLYVLIAYVATRLAPLSGNGIALALWALQIALNTLWTPVFFGARRMGIGLIVISLLWLTVAALIWHAWALDGLAALLLLPYLAWLSVATALNAWIWRNNRNAA